MSASVQPYGLDPEFERALVALSCSRPRFFGRIASALDPAALVAPEAVLAVKAAQAIAADVGHGPEAPLLVIQRLRRWMNEGKVTLEEIDAVNDYLDVALDAGLPTEDSVVNEVSPILRRRMQNTAVQTAMSEFAKRGDFASVTDILSKASRIGEADSSVGTRLGVDSFDVIEQIRNLERLPTGVPELDIALEGGLWRGALGVVVGSTGEGKSIMLSHVAAESLLAGLHVAYATLELPEAIVLARIKANITGVPINEILNGSMERARAEIERRAKKMGSLVVRYFTSGATTVDDLRDWITRCEDEVRRPVDLLVVDYADKMSIPRDKQAATRSDTNYQTQGLIYEGLRVFAEQRKIWTWTASQKKRITEKGKSAHKADTDDVADSVNKSRVCDLMITLNARGEENDQLLFYVAKNRMGKAHVSVGPLPNDFSLGRISMVNR